MDLAQNVGATRMCICIPYFTVVFLTTSSLVCILTIVIRCKYVEKRETLQEAHEDRPKNHVRKLSSLLAGPFDH